MKLRDKLAGMSRLDTMGWQNDFPFQKSIESSVNCALYGQDSKAAEDNGILPRRSFVACFFTKMLQRADTHLQTCHFMYTQGQKILKH